MKSESCRILGIIFDMDGVIIDSNKVHYSNFVEVMQRLYQKTISIEDFAINLGMNDRQFRETMKKHGVTDFDKFMSEVRKDHSKLKNGIRLKEGVKEILARMPQKKALATGATRDAAIYTVTNFDIARYFDFIIGGDEVHLSKPHPEIFLNAAKGIKIDPRNCVVIEDSMIGMQAAKAANMKVIAMEDEITNHQDHSIADLKISSMLELEVAIKKLEG